MNECPEQHVAEVLTELDESLCARLIVLRRWFHQHPKLSFQEANTAERIIAELKWLDIACEYAGVGHSVIGNIARKVDWRIDIGVTLAARGFYRRS